MDFFFVASNEVMLSRLIRQMTSTIIPLLSSALNNGIKDGLLNIENADFYAKYIIYGSLGALNRGGSITRENITQNLDNLPRESLTCQILILIC